MRTICISTFLFFCWSFAQARQFYFPPLSGSTWETTNPASLNWCQTSIDSLYSFLEANNTKAFILLKDGRIVLERYFGTHGVNTPWQWASAGKTITSFLVGIAQQENLLSINDRASTFLGPGWTSATPEQEDRITIWHQLTMTSGLDDEVADPFCTLNTCLLYKADAGTRWAYHNGPYTLLDGVIENATQMTLNAFTTQRLKEPTGMTGAFFRIGNNNVYFSNARSMARFGLLILNNGNWNGNQIMTDTSFFSQMISSSQPLNQSYGYLWWLNGQQTFMVPGLQLRINGPLFPDAPAEVFTAMGKDGQFLNVWPSEGIVWIRMGETPGTALVPYLLNNQIWQHLNQLQCTGTVIEENNVKSRKVEIFPVPATNILNVKANEAISKVEIFNLQGHIIKSVRGWGNDLSIPVGDLPKGLFPIRVEFKDNAFWNGKFMK